jgi:transcription elongation factor Elf1
MVTNATKEYPEINHEGQIFFVIGCRKCGKDGWSIAITKDKKKAIAKCMHCDHVVEIKLKEAVTRGSDIKVLDMRLCT